MGAVITWPGEVDSSQSRGAVHEVLQGGGELHDGRLRGAPEARVAEAQPPQHALRGERGDEAPPGLLLHRRAGQIQIPQLRLAMSGNRGACFTGWHGPWLTGDGLLGHVNPKELKI